MHPHASCHSSPEDDHGHRPAGPIWGRWHSVLDAAAVPCELEVEMDYEAIVVGSGFGGSVAATNLARAKKQALILERGTWWLSPEEVGSPPAAEPGDGRVESAPRAPPS
jgi:hypothetical protein